MKMRIAKKTGNLTNRQKTRIEHKYLDHHCAQCGKYWCKNENRFFAKYGCCNETCMMECVGLSPSDYYGTGVY